VAADRLSASLLERRSNYWVRRPLWTISRQRSACTPRKQNPLASTNTTPRRSNPVDAAYHEGDAALDHLSAALGLQHAV